MRLCRRLWPDTCFVYHFLLLFSKWGVVYQVSLMTFQWMVHLQYVAPVTLKVGQKYALNDFATNTCTHRTKSWPPGFYNDDFVATFAQGENVFHTVPRMVKATLCRTLHCRVAQMLATPSSSTSTSHHIPVIGIGVTHPPTHAVVDNVILVQCILFVC